MQTPPDDTDASARLPTGERRWWLIRAALLIAGVALAAVASAVLLVGGWGESIPPSAVAYGDGQIEIFEAATPQLVATPTVVERPSATAPPTARLAAQPTPTTFAVDDASPNTVVAPTPRPAAPPSNTEVAAPTARPAASLPELVPESTAPPPAPATATSPPPPPPPTSTPVPPPPSCPSAAITGYAYTLFAAINQERVSFGVPALGAAGCVTYVAQIRSDDMANLNYFDHTSPGSGDTAFSLMDAYRVPYGWAGENLARNNYPDDQTVAVAIRDLMASEGHRANILNTNFTHIGVAMAVDGVGMKYFTMLFIGPP